MVKDLTLSGLSKALGFYYWTKNKISGEEFWSGEIYDIIREDPSSSFSIHEFTISFVHENDQHPFIEAIENYMEYQSPFEMEIRVRKKNGNYYWLQCKSADKINDTLCPKEHLIVFVDINAQKKYKMRYDENKFFYQESAEMTRTGGWFIDFEHKKTYWDRGTRKILEIGKDVKPTIKNGISFFAKGYRFKAMKHFLDCSLNGFPFHIEVKLNTSRGRTFWAIIIGRPIYQPSTRKIIGIRGVIQDIYELKIKEISIQKSMDIIASQNSRLYNFAHIVSHNLRSHSSNLELVSELFKGTNDPAEKDELFNTVTEISYSLNKTIEHLNEVAAIHTRINKKMERVQLSKTLQLVMASIKQIVMQEKAIIESDFSEVDELTYIPAYLESIMLNLITNAIKYKHPDRIPHIKIRSYRKGEKIRMEVSDNGIGIDLETFGSKIFGMYKTFHQADNAVGIGLFLTKNQIESLNGSIDVQSEVGTGTTFIINF
ncbi:PAS domain-containing protein [Leptobacterium flavescens]|uniref:histidine kinase n=1 Tax=Leptobacterium flavescens TaxID=472055 RepID=A0A6P0UPQ1_9FLAO|nr:ATP-binding protein [Leptobacterium flavescens]NER14450.1 PAS domain-containing protein [Leptobacterium flavescens]